MRNHIDVLIVQSGCLLAEVLDEDAALPEVFLEVHLLSALLSLSPFFKILGSKILVDEVPVAGEVLVPGVLSVQILVIGLVLVPVGEFTIMIVLWVLIFLATYLSISFKGLFLKVFEDKVQVGGLGLLLKDLGVAEQVFGLVLVLVVPRLLLLFGHCAF